MKPLRRSLVVAGLLAVAGLAVVWLSNPQMQPRAVAQSSEQTDNRRRSADEPSSATEQIPAALRQTLALPADNRALAHPVALAVAEGVILEHQIEPGTTRNSWTRSQLVQTKVQPRPVRVVETWTQAAPTGEWICQRRDMYLADQLIVKARPGISADQFKQQIATLGMTCDAPVNDGVFTVRLSQNNLAAAPNAMRLLAIHPEIAVSAEIDGVGFGGSLPNDPYFALQWGLHNTGQSGGTVNADVDAPDFWDHITSTPGIVIAVLDTGLNYTHPDLQNLAWVNPGETAGDGVDNDHDGLVDDVNGWDFVNSDNDPTDDHGHGSNVTGIIAANRNNTEGVSGLISGVHILACKVINANNSGTTSNLIAAVTYARLRGVPLMNLSLQNYPYSSTLDAEFTACQSTGILLCICAGNQGVDNDATPNYPSCYPQPNIIAVGNHDRTDERYSGSNYGATSVDIFAPGREILAPVLGTAYAYYTGTSQATPHVTAVAAALKYLHPTWSAPEIKNQILASAIPRPSYAGISVTGGRLNAFAALGVSNAPVFTLQPVAQSLPAGSSCTFTAAADGVPAPTYQWKKNGIDISGATRNSYTIASPGITDAGSYVVVATNSSGSATSNVATLSIIVAPSGAVISITVE